MGLRDLLKKKEKIEDAQDQPAMEAAPAVTIMRSATNMQEIIQAPSFPQDHVEESVTNKRHSRFGRLSRNPSTDDRPKDRSITERLHLSGSTRSRSVSTSSVNLPTDLPPIEGGVASSAEQEATWEKRATILAKGTTIIRPGSSQGASPGVEGHGELHSTNGRVSDEKGDENIQEAIRLHEEGDLERSTLLFGRLADPNGQNNALSQVLYGLALRHGWGIEKNEEKAVEYLSQAASNSAEIESLALGAGMKKGGAAKGELTLAIFELANCFRQGWGVKKDAAAAKQYYETAANMGDTDAMNEIAWCYLEGFGCKKDKFKAAQFLRLAEERGNKTLGNSWIWKDKYGGPMKKSAA